MNISKIYKLDKSQHELDFIDIDVDRDIPLFLDSHFLSARSDAWSIDASGTIRNFFQFFITLIKAGDSAKAYNLFSHLHEPNETCLGLSRAKPQGKGVGRKQSEQIFKSLLNSKAIKTGIVEDLEDCHIFVEGVGRDKISDMTTNIIRQHLVEYTQKQCELWGISLQASVPSGYMWDENGKMWINEHTKMLVVDGKKRLLVPKAIVSYSNQYTPGKYHQYFVLNFLQNEHLTMNSALVQKRRKKDGTVSKFVTKKSLIESEAPLSKEFLVEFTQKHPEVFEEFKLSVDKNMQSIDSEELTSKSLKDVAGHLITVLNSISVGTECATKYHRVVAGILELIFYPHLITPRMEKEIHDGRKRIDITFDNAAQDGSFFERLHKKHNMSCPYIFIECKNYSQDVANPELDQISGRFSPKRGKVGIVVCRSINDMKEFLKRCSDTYKDGRGLVIPMVDEDLIKILMAIQNNDNRLEESLLADRLRLITLN